MPSGAQTQPAALRCIRLAPRPGAAPSGRPPVRLFVGTERAQARAARVFVWSIERHRDPGRLYEIYLLRDLPGFRTRGWTTGFTNYRFSIPHYAGGRGRALYNDVDQVYLAAPGELFDRELGDRGWRAVTPGDSSVMLLDCARMADVWTLEAAQRESKRRLHARGAERWGSLPPEWNARDDDEYEPGRTRLLHFTTLHTQPWRPFPERFVYEDHPQGELWHELERSADAAGFQLTTRERPSPGFAAAAGGEPPERALAKAPDDDVPWLLDELFRGPDARVQLSLPCGPGRDAGFWTRQLEAASRRHPDAHYEAELRIPGRRGRRRVEIRTGGRRVAAGPPTVWVLTDDRPGNTTQSLGLAGALGWPYEVKRIRCTVFARLNNQVLGASRLGVDRSRSSPLEPPWPDLAIASGRRLAPVLAWINRQSRGRTRTVILGRKGGTALDRLDLAVTPRYARLFPHARRIETSAPLHAVTPDRLADAAAHWHSRLAKATPPRIAVLVGGSSGQYRLDEDVARRLAEDVSRMARNWGGSLLATTSRRTGPRATEAFCAALDAEAVVHTWTPGDVENPYLGFLALADAFVITGDSESMFAEAASRERPVYVYPLPERRAYRIQNVLREAVAHRARSRPAGPRGTPRPQRGLERLCARLIERGFVRPSRDLSLLHAELARRGVLRSFGDAAGPGPGGAEPSGLDDMDRVVARIRALLGMPPL